MATLKTGVTIMLGFAPIKVNVKTIVEGEKSTSMSNVCVGTPDAPHDPIRIKQVNRCPNPDCLNEDKGSHAKARAVSKTELVIVPEEELDKMADEAKKFSEAMPITLHPADEVLASTTPTGTAYYLEPEGPAFNEPYAMLVDMLRKHPEKAAVTMWAARTAPALYLFEARGDVLVARQLAWPHQVQAAPAVPHGYNPAWEAQAESMFASAETEFDPNTYRDVRGDILSNYVASQTPVFASDATTASAPAGGLDYMALLQASTEAAKAARGEAPKAPAKKKAAKKAVAKAS
jgi:non-homologous end joining protein Ku